MADAGFAATLSGHDKSSEPLPEGVNHNMDQEKDKSVVDGDTCRICRSEGTTEEPLFHPCKCSGSIKHVHQECLMEWLSHTNKKHCELCKTPFRFTKLYDADMPDALPFTIFLAQAGLHVVKYCLTWLRAFLVGSIWLVVLPWCVRWSWRIVFFMMDAGWAREPWILNLAYPSTNVSLTQEELTTFLSNSNLTAEFAKMAQANRYPLILQVFQIVWEVMTEPWRWKHHNPTVEVNPVLNRTAGAASSSLLSNFDFAHTMTDSPFLNRALLDVMEGQIITIVVVVVIILVFLIREWVIQQQPILNAAVHVRDAEQELERVEQARRRLREEIRLVEEQLELLNGSHTALDRVQPSASLSSSENGQRSRSRTSHVPSTLSGDVPSHLPHIDWADFKQRITVASENWTAADRARTPDSVTMVRNLTDEVVEIIRQAEQSQNSDVDTFSSLIEWVRRIPPEVDSAWLSDLATEFAHLKSGQQDAIEASSENTHVRDQDTTLASSSGSSSRSGIHTPNEDQVNTSEIPSTTEDSQQTANPQHATVDDSNRCVQDNIDVETGNPQVPPLGPNYHGRVEHVHAANTASEREHRSDSPDSWQAIHSQGDQPSKEETTSRHSDSAARVEDDEDQTASAEISGPSNTDSIAEQVSPSAAIGYDDAVTAEPPAPSSSGYSTPTRDITAAPAQADSQSRSSNPAPRENIIDNLYDFFWGGIDLTDLPHNVPEPEAGDQNLDEVQIVEIGGHDHPEEIEELIVDGPIRDPEVLAAAAEAGLDAEAVEDAEDLEGVMELIGMQGPIVVLFQTAMICGGLITLTLWGAIGTPYLFGKLVLQLLRDPVMFFVIVPLQMLTNAGDLLLDVATLLTGGCLHWCLTFMTQILFLFQIRFIFEPAPTYADNLANASRIAAERAATHLVDLFAFDGSAAGTESYFLLGSLQAHSALNSLKFWFANIISYVSTTFTRLVSSPENIGIQSALSWAQSLVSFVYNDLRRDFVFVRDLASNVKSGNIFSMTVREPRQLDLDPILSYWNGKDRALTIGVGYAFLTLAGAAYLLRSEPLFSSPTLQRIEKAFSDVLKQAGGVVKVILIISIEMLLFPLYCGCLLDVALLPLFDGVTLESRITYASNRPYMFTFLHWFLGTAYMFNFALFVSMCRGILRSGVLYFIRDPDDPTFHPVRDVLERNISTQLRKIAFSALVYGLMVILCMGGVVWGIAKSNAGVFPLRWSTPDPALEFPLEFIIYNFLSPFLFKFLQPSIGAEAVYEWWLRRCARVLRLSHFLFGERKLDEEGQANTQDKSKGGSYVRVPASDQVRVTRGQPVFTSVTEEEVAKDDAEQECSQHGSPRQRYRNVYIPSWFRLRIGLFLAGLWTLSAGIGIGLTILPLAVGRGLCSAVLPEDVYVNDIWAFALGLHTLLVASFALFRLPKLSSKFGGTVKDAAQSAIGAKLKHGIICAVKIIYVYGFGLVVIPSLAFVLIHLYIVLPIRTYAESVPASPASTGISLNPANISALFSSANKQTAAPTKPALHVIYAFPDWTLGFVICRLIISFVPYTRYALPTAIMRQITRNGKLNPDAWLATRAVVLPTIVICNLALFAPATFAALINKILLPMFLPTDYQIGKDARTKIYRYAYPIFLAHALALWGTLGVNKAMVKWKGRIKDEVYLVGERLHNFGEQKPPKGSKGIMKKGKEPVAVQQAGIQ
ncbi:hypothetical protein K461DRAFT_274775 [Myriangium duriaei CBS 260.36]|uniref:RING-type E3 ubiquitin transferase n=1 Tax=Myriangium duriaei CBS 260.36 TaxID=1168546 RepID=A0A9P4MN13_9PEZI|nr:hypothetical protein K461DRAFT_274775 [Myriangium duriaei CBS 260.36]